MGSINLIKTDLEDVYIIENLIFKDGRGTFIKTYHEDIFKQHNLCTNFKESYYSISNKGVIRGMHFQLPPCDHEKLVYVPKGKILDVVIDLRKSSKTFKKFISVELSEDNGYSIYIPKGLAHGFRALEDNTIAVYNVSTVYNQSADSGIRWNSFGMNWNEDSPIMSERDKAFISLDEFKYGDLW